MNPLHPRPQHRLVLAYAGLAGVSAIVLVLIWPEQRAGIATMFATGLAAAWVIGHIGAEIVRRRVHAVRMTADAAQAGQFRPAVDPPSSEDFLKLGASVQRLANQLQQTAAEQQQLRQQLTRSEKLALLGELAATVAHEINNPLDGLQNSLRIVRRGPRDSIQTEQLFELMEGALGRIEMTVRRLLTLSRDQALRLAPTSLSDVVDEAVAFVQSRLQRRGIDLVRDFPDEPVAAMADRAQLAQVLINLMINATDAMSAGGTLTITARAEPDTATLEVADTGTGIPEQHLKHIFEPFYTTKPVGAGTGLGLAVVARIIEAHKGRIEVQTEPGRGTCFRIELPVPCLVPTPADGSSTSTAN